MGRHYTVRELSEPAVRGRGRGGRRAHLGVSLRADASGRPWRRDSLCLRHARCLAAHGRGPPVADPPHDGLLAELRSHGRPERRDVADLATLAGQRRSADSRPGRARGTPRPVAPQLAVGDGLVPSRSEFMQDVGAGDHKGRGRATTRVGDGRPQGSGTGDHKGRGRATTRVGDGRPQGSGTGDHKGRGRATTRVGDGRPQGSPLQARARAIGQVGGRHAPRTRRSGNQHHVALVRQLARMSHQGR